MEHAAHDPTALLANAGWLKELARRLVRDAHLAEDVAQDTWLAVLERPPRGLEAPRSWLARVAGNAARGRRRSDTARARREAARAGDGVEAPASVVVERAQLHALLVEELLAMREPRRATILRHFFEGASTEDIARDDEVSPSTVRGRLQRGLEELRERFDRRSGGEGRGLAALAAWVDTTDPAPAGSAAALSPLGGLSVFAGLSLGKLVLAGLAIAAVGWWYARGDTGGVRPPDAPVVAATDAVQLVEGEARGKAAVAAPAPVERVAVQKDGELVLAVVELPCAHVLEAQRAAVGVTVALDVRSVAPETELHPEADKWALGMVWRRQKETVFADELVTGEAGEVRVVLPELRPGERRVARIEVARDATWRTTTEFLELPRAGPLRLERAAHGYVEGRVFLGENEPLGGARLELAGGGFERADLVATTDVDGHFRIGPVLDMRGSALTSPGFAGYDQRVPERLATGGWSELTLYATRAGRLQLSVADESGPVPNAIVRVQLDASSVRTSAETTVLGTVGFYGGPVGHGGVGTKIEGVTDARGAVVLEGLWLERRLFVAIEVDGVQQSTARRRGAELVFRQAEADLEGCGPLVLHAERENAWRAELPTNLVVRGRVVNADGSAEAGAVLRFSEERMNRSDAEGPGWSARAKADDAGRFTQLVPGQAATDRILVTAQGGRGSDRAGERLQSLGYVDMAPPATSRGALGAVVLAPRAADERERDVVLEIAPRPSISGRVVRPDGSSPKGSVRALQVGDDPRARASFGQEAFCPLGGDGSFTLVDLEEGRYDLEFSIQMWNEFFTFPTSTPVIRDVAAGTKDLELLLEDEEPVDVHLSLVLPEGDTLGDWMIVQGRLQPNGVLEAPRLEPRTVVRTARALPDGLHLNFAGITGAIVPEGSWSLGMWGGQGARVELPPVQPGYVGAGVLANDARGRPYLPMMSGPWRADSGEHELVFELIPTGSIRGRVRVRSGHPSDVELAVALAGPDGALLSLKNNAQRATRTLPVAGDGRFRIDVAPVGPNRVRVGPPGELLTGGGAEFAADVERGAWTELDLELP